ncbi:unnamed protein product [Acanthoscelides obtectus]|uniref:Uncharacterized protein n=1 Tax=Acanthoscelides obtectus TaxID=200917 RepID=A0A9P0L661_ACAOB|nr:unnamed protein product [Acanthoscelides obtectus]CAK1673997.1 hypothetical protein AOBTE_LOCUS29498 [Acanthoscelides obtectus]
MLSLGNVFITFVLLLLGLSAVMGDGCIIDKQCQRNTERGQKCETQTTRFVQYGYEIKLVPKCLPAVGNKYRKKECACMPDSKKS